jgi:hypothetical protein
MSEGEFLMRVLESSPELMKVFTESLTKHLEVWEASGMPPAIRYGGEGKMSEIEMTGREAYEVHLNLLGFQPESIVAYMRVYDEKMAKVHEKAREKAWFDKITVVGNTVEEIPPENTATWRDRPPLL